MNQQSSSSTSQEINGLIDNSPIYVTSLSTAEAFNNNPVSGSATTGSEFSPKSKGVASLPTSTSSSVKAKSADGHGDTDLILTQRLADSSEAAGDGTPKWCGGAAAAATALLDLGNSADNKVPAASVSAGDRRASSPFQNGRTEVLIGAEDNKFKTTAVVESNNNKLGIDQEQR